jgi:DNA-binding IclR family transcriptional regulator
MTMRQQLVLTTGRYFVRAVGKALRLLEVLHAHPGGIRLRDASREAELEDSTALRLLTTMEQLGYVRRDGEAKTYFVGLRVYELAGQPSPVANLPHLARPHLERLQRLTGEDVHLATLDVGEALCIETLKSSHILAASFSTGFRIAVHASAVGKAILAFLDDPVRDALLLRLSLDQYTPRTLCTRDQLLADLRLTRDRGYSLDEGEFSLGVSCIGAPVFNPDRRVIASVSVTAPSQRRPGAALMELAGAIRATADAISETLQSLII